LQNLSPITVSFGTSVEGRPLDVAANFSLNGDQPPPGISLFIGGIHGDEPATVVLLGRFIAMQLAEMPTPVALVPLANPDGFFAESRYNRNGVDLNRNFPYRWRPDSVESPGPAPLSEPESIALHDLMLTLRPARIVSLHWALAEIEADGHRGNELAQRLWEALSASQRLPFRLRLYDRENPPEDYCPGSLGQWCGHAPEFEAGHRAEMVTLELPYDPALPRPRDPLPAEHLDRVKASWRSDPDRYIDGVGPAVERMLVAACS
jgi:protein MpaA